MQAWTGSKNGRKSKTKNELIIKTYRNTVRFLSKNPIFLVQSLGLGDV